jgi:hypothetical protein
VQCSFSEAFAFELAVTFKLFVDTYYDTHNFKI